MDKYIEKVIYINLKDRTDRKKTCEETLNKLFSKDKIIRLDAIKHEKGYIGCALSHLKCLELAIENNWKNVLIVEDDILWTKDSIDIFIKLIKNPYDVIILGGTFIYYNPFNYYLYSCSSTNSYIVNKKYLKTLYKFWNSKMNHLIKNNYTIDQSWKELQWKDNWKIVYPPIFIQRESESDILNCKVNYRQFHYTTNVKNFLFHLKIKIKKKGKYLIVFFLFCIFEFVFFFKIILITLFLYYRYFVKYNRKHILNIGTSKIDGGINQVQLKYQTLFKNSILISQLNNKISSKKIYLFFSLIYFIFKYRPNKIISHCQKVTKLLKIINYFFKIPYLIHVIHGNNYCKNINNANKIFYLNNYQKEELIKHKIIHKSIYFPNFLVSYNNSEKKILSIKKIGLIGRFSEEKNFETIIKSMVYLKNYELIIAGSGILDYQHIIKEYNLKNIKFIGWVNKKIFYEMVDIVVIPSKFESFPMVAIESISFKKLVICSKNEGCLQIFNKIDERIFVNDKFNPKEYSDKIMYFSKNINLTNKIIEKNYKYFIKNFTLDSAKKRLLINNIT
jgi:glycosyl transferase, family 25